MASTKPHCAEAEEARLERLHGRAYALFYGHAGRRDRRRAVRLYRAAAEGGLAHTWRNLGLCFEYGDGVRKDLRRAFACYMRGAELGDSPAKRCVAACLISGSGVKRDADAGLALLARDARRDVDSRRELARRLLEGDGVEQDTARGLRLLRRGAAAGHAACWSDLAVQLHDHGRSPRARQEATELCKRAARAGVAQACVNLARAYSSGDGVRQNERAAVAWLKRAVECDAPGEFGCDDAYLLLAQHHLAGRGVRKSLRAAERLLEFAARCGSERARRRLRALRRGLRR